MQRRRKWEVANVSMITCQRVVEAFPTLLQQPHASRCLRFVTVSIAFPSCTSSEEIVAPTRDLKAIFARYPQQMLAAEGTVTYSKLSKKREAPARRPGLREEIARRDSE